jgi:hypothetical protein
LGLARSTGYCEDKAVGGMPRFRVGTAMFHSRHCTGAASIVDRIAIQFRLEDFREAHSKLYPHLKHEGLDCACSWWGNIHKRSSRGIGNLPKISFTTEPSSLQKTPLLKPTVLFHEQIFKEGLRKRARSDQLGPPVAK